jgi:hypothetical protein
VTLDSHHVYSTSPAFSRREVIAAIRAHVIEIYDPDGCMIATHRRVSGNHRSESIDAVSTVRYLAKKPGAWKNSMLRHTMPDAVVARMDTLDKDALRKDLMLLAESIERSGVASTFDALDVLACEHTDFPDFFQVGVLAARIAELGLGLAALPGGDLDIYDKLFLVTEEDI